MPPQTDRRVLVTGTGGLGLEDATALARAGADVIIAGRDTTKGHAAVERIRADVASAAVRFEAVDLADLASIAALASRLERDVDRLDLLINNAGVMTPPQRRTTADDFELQFGTNHLGHFALTGRLLPLLAKSDAARVVTVSSVAARRGAIDFTDLQSERAYKPMVAYAQSKLANLLFSLELQRRSDAGKWGITSVAAHPGVTRTDLIVNGTGAHSLSARARKYLWFLFQPVDRGALPTLFAATSPQVAGGSYHGPDKLNEMRGHPTVAKFPERALDDATAERLWQVSEELTGVHYDVAPFSPSPTAAPGA